MIFFNNDNEGLSHEDNDGKDQNDYPGRQVKDSTSNNHSKYQINHVIVYTIVFYECFFLFDCSFILLNICH
jgi:hypothetical protein